MNSIDFPKLQYLSSYGIFSETKAERITRGLLVPQLITILAALQFDGTGNIQVRISFKINFKFEYK